MHWGLRVIKRLALPIFDHEVTSSNSAGHKRQSLINTNEPRHEKTCFLPYANNKDADRRLCYSLPRLYTRFYIRNVKPMAVQAGLSLTWSQTPKTGFLVTRLKYLHSPNAEIIPLKKNMMPLRRYISDHLSRLMAKPTKWLCAQRRLRSVWASAQSDQSSLCAEWVAKDPRFLHADS